MSTPLSRRTALRVAVATVAVPLLAGCNLIGALAYKTVGPNEIDAEYKLPLAEPVLVLAENYQRGTLQSAADELAELVFTDLQAHKAGTLIPPDKLMQLRSQKPERFNLLRIQEVGQAVGAKQIIYINLKELDVTGVTGSDAVSGKISATVRVVDVATGQTKWPDIGSDREFHASTNFVPETQVDSLGVMRTQMAQDLSVQIAQLFYKYKPEDESKGRT
jgi:hypothetical protein